MESRNKLTMCRLCLCENEGFINIFEMNDWQGYVAAEVISDLLQFQVSEADAYPQVVCSTCLTKLTEFKLFKKCCQKSKVAYDNMFSSSENLVKNQSEMVEVVTIKVEPVDYLDNEENVLKVSSDPVSVQEDKLQETCPVEVSSHPNVADRDEEFKEERMQDAGVSDSELCEQDPLGEASSDEAEGGGKETIEGKRDTFECYHCKKVLKTRGGLKTHLLSHGLGKLFNCEVCGKTSGSRERLLKHLQVHMVEKSGDSKDGSAGSTRRRRASRTQAGSRRIPSVNITFLKRLEPKGNKHWPVKGNRLRCRVCSAKNKYARTCFRCSVCEVGLCVAPCFEEYHTKATL